MAANTQENITQAAVSDAVRIEAERAAEQLAKATGATGASVEAGVDLTDLSEKEARKLESEEHKALGYRPPKGSLAAEAKAAAAKHPEGSGEELNRADLRDVAQLDAARVELEQSAPSTGALLEPEAVVGVAGLTEKEARKLESEEHKALGYRPPPHSLAAEAKSVASKDPAGSGGPELTRSELRDIAQLDAARVELENAGIIDGAGAVDGVGVGPFSAKEARKLESEEHKALGYRPPKDSLAAEAMREAAKHPEGAGGPELNRAELREVAELDAARIEAEKGAATGATGGVIGVAVDKDVSLEGLSEKEARKLESEEHKVLGYRPPKGSVAAEAMSEAAKHPEGDGRELTRAELRELAKADAVLVEAEKSGAATSPTLSAASSSAPPIDLNSINAKEARKLMSEEHKLLGHRPPPGSLAAEAQSAAAKHPDAPGAAGGRELNRAELREVAAEDAVRIDEAIEPKIRRGSRGSRGSTGSVGRISPTGLTGAAAKIELDKISAKEARKLMSEEHKILGYRPPPGSLAAEAQSAAAKHPEGVAPKKELNRKELREAALEDAARIEAERLSQSPPSLSATGELSPPAFGGLSTGTAPSGNLDLEHMTKDQARELQSEEQRILGYRPPRESIAAAAQSLTDRMDNAPRGIRV